MALAIAACTSSAHAKQGRDLTWRPATDLVVSAFAHYPLVALSEGAGHGQLETLDFFSALIRDRRFARTVKNVVIESRWLIRALDITRSSFVQRWPCRCSPCHGGRCRRASRVSR